MNRIQFIRRAVVAAVVAGALGSVSCVPEGEAERNVDAPVVAVHVGQLRRATLERRVTGYGTVEPEPAGGGHPGAGSRIAAPVAGIVAAVLCSEGGRVERGDLLFRLDQRLAKVDVDFARLNLDREQKLLPIGGTSEQAMQDAKRELAAAGVRNALLEINAPFAGIITRVYARPGEYIDASRALGVLTDSDRLVVATGVPSTELDGLVAGKPARLFLAGHAPIATEVTYVSPDVDPRTGTALVRAAVPPGAGLRSGQFVRVQFVVEERLDRLVIPVAGILETPDGGAAIAVVEGDRARRVPVARGLRDSDLVEIEGRGLAAGMKVVTQGAYGLPDDVQIRVVGP